MNKQPQLVTTLTGEIFQPVRLYYRIHDMDKVSQIFGRLSCMEFDSANKRWTWVYDKEAKFLKFKNSYSSLRKRRGPIVLGSFYSDANDEMHLDVGSIERATKAVVFFDQRLRRVTAEITYIAIYNGLLPQTEYPGANFDKLFAEVRTDEIDARQEGKIERVSDMVKSGRVMDILQERHFELVEAFPAHFYSDGIRSIETALQWRQMVAFKRWQGDKDFTLTDLITASLPNWK